MGDRPKATPYPTREDILEAVRAKFYEPRILNNAHRGDVVEMMVLMALGAPWRFVGLGWHPWDLERGSGSHRLRIQVKQCAALQLWGRTRRPTVVFRRRDNTPSYFEKDNPSAQVESDGWFCEIFVCGVHREVDADRADQLDPTQWRFLVIPTADLAPRTKTMVLSKALERWPLHAWHELAEAVDTAVQRSGFRSTGDLGAPTSMDAEQY